MRILVTNDDGIMADGLKVAEEIAASLAGPEGEVWTVAPAMEQSGVGHCMSYVKPMRIEQTGERRFAVEGSPADCVMAGVCHVLGNARPDLILSGVNRGHNVAEDTLYSGTIGAAMEGALQGVRSIAMSQYYGPRNFELDDQFEAARTHGPAIIRSLVENAQWERGNYGVFYNVNFPPLPASEVKGVKATSQGERPAAPFTVEAQTAPNRRTYLWIKGTGGNDGCATGTDAREAFEGYATVTPLKADLTARTILGDLQGVLPDLEGQN